MTFDSKFGLVVQGSKHGRLVINMFSNIGDIYYLPFRQRLFPK